MAGFKFKNAVRTKVWTQKHEKLDTVRTTLFPYKRAALATSNDQEWYVYYSYLNPETGKFKRFKERAGLNDQRYLQMMATHYGKTVEETRRILAEEIIKVIDQELAQGFDPFKQQQIAAGNTATVLGAVTAIVEERNRAATKNARETYNLMLSRLRKFLTDKQLTEYPVALISADHAKQFQQYLQLEQQLAKKTVNSTISHVGKFWEILHDRKLVRENPFRAVKPLTDKAYRGIEKDEEDVFEALTNAELDAIFQELKKQNQQAFIRFLGMIYYAWIRPVEITRLRISDIDLKNQLIVLRKRDTKNDKGGRVQIVPPLMDLLQEMNLEDVQDKSWYLFSKGFEPGPTQLDSSRGVGYLVWNPVVKKLGINKKMYALKHTGNIEYLLQNKGNVDLKWQQMQNRHSSAAQTENYNRKLGAYFIDVGNVNFRKLSK